MRIENGAAWKRPLLADVCESWQALGSSGAPRSQRCPAERGLRARSGCWEDGRRSIQQLKFQCEFRSFSNWNFNSASEISAKIRSFSAVSAPILARKYAFCSIFQNLPDSLADFFEIWQNFAKCLLNFHEIADFSNPFFSKILRLQECRSIQIL